MVPRLNCVALILSIPSGLMPISSCVMPLFQGVMPLSKHPPLVPLLTPSFTLRLLTFELLSLIPYLSSNAFMISLSEWFGMNCLRNSRISSVYFTFLRAITSLSAIHAFCSSVYLMGISHAFAFFDGG